MGVFKLRNSPSNMYDKLIQILIWEIVKPERAMIMGGTWRIPMLMGLLDKNFVKDLKMDGGRKISAVKSFSCVLAGVI